MAVINKRYKSSANTTVQVSNGISFMGVVKEYDTYQEMIQDRNPGKFAIVKDATGDPTVNKGGAFYRIVNAGIVRKLFEDETMDSDLDVRELTASVEELRNIVSELKLSSDSNKVIFIRGGTEETPSILTFEPNVLYVATSSFNGALPKAPKDGTIVRLCTGEGFPTMLVHPTGIDKIHGATATITVGVNPDGIVCSNASYTFVYDANQKNWIIL